MNKEKKKWAIASIIFLALYVSASVVGLFFAFARTKFIAIFSAFKIVLSSFRFFCLYFGDTITFLIICFSLVAITKELRKDRVVSLKTSMVCFAVMFIWDFVLIGNFFMPLFTTGALIRA